MHLQSCQYLIVFFIIIQGILAIGTGAAANLSTLCYDTEACTWASLDKFPSLPRDDGLPVSYSACNAEGTLYILSRVSNFVYSQFFKLDVDNNKWIKLAPMRVKSRKARLIYLDGCIYAFGCGSNPRMYIIEENVWSLTSVPPVPYGVEVTYQSCATYEGKIIVYGTPPIVAGAAAGTTSEHRLLMFDPASTSWSELMTESHPISSFTGLLEHNRKCYRVAYGNCKCTAAGCHWHGKIVQELVIDVHNMNAAAGNKQDQNFEEYDANRSFWRINGDVFVSVRGKLFITGIHEKKAIFSDYLCINDLTSKYHRNLITSFAFDAEKWA